MKLTKNFDLYELVRSNTARRLGLDNTPSVNVVQNLTNLCVAVLQPIRDYYRLPTDVTSGYRHPLLNAIINKQISEENYQKGNYTVPICRSEHCYGFAADFRVRSVSIYEVCLFIQKTLPFNQLIMEHYNKDNISVGWVHVSYKHNDTNKFQTLTATRNKAGKTIYLPGFIL
jgi:hypothetical protein